MTDVEEIKHGNATRYYIVGTNILHRDDGPAIVYNDGSKVWYQYGKRHREDGPAFEYKDGSKYWYRFDLLHRIDGSAIEAFPVGKAWYIEGKQVLCYSQEEFESSEEYRSFKLKAFW